MLTAAQRTFSLTFLVALIACARSEGVSVDATLLRTDWPYTWMSNTCLFSCLEQIRSDQIRSEFDTSDRSDLHFMIQTCWGGQTPDLYDLQGRDNVCTRMARLLRTTSCWPCWPCGICVARQLCTCLPCGRYIIQLSNNISKRQL